MYKLCILTLLISFSFANIIPLGWELVTTANGQFPPLDSLRPVVYNGRTYSFGGFTENQDPSIPNVWSNAVYVFNGFHWTLQPTTGTPPTARGYDVVFVRQGGLYVVFGGSYDSSYGDVVQTNEMTRLDLSTFVWSPVTYNNAAPGGCFAPSGWYEPSKDSLYIFGGIDLNYYAPRNTTYKFNFTSGLWTTLTFATYPSARYDPSLSYLLGIATIYGGETVTKSFSFVIPLDIQWNFNVWTETWTQIFPTASPTPPRNNGNGMAYDILGQLVLYGGDIGGGSFCPNWFLQNSVNETWLFTPVLNTWTKAATSAAPPPLKRAGTFFLNGVNYLYGGFWFTGCTVNRNQNTYFFI